MSETNEVVSSSNEPIDLLGEAYNQNIRPFIDVIDNLRRFGLQQDVDLPNVVVVGDQSSGKSSIIEAISGIQLPRGKGIVTRCPLELQLKRVIDKPWKAFLQYKILSGVTETKVITDPNNVEENIRQAQEKMCITSKGVSRELITLRIESPAKTAPDLTLIDLPGIARIAVEGQPADICNQIKRIIMDHVSNINTVILCVVSANLDAAVNESINIARGADPNGIRTLGVITKPDMTDEANKEDVLCLLNNEKINLHKGFHMVKCRSQKELDEGLSLEQSIENEKIFFEDDKYYRTANKSQLGTNNLASKITEELVSVIQNNLPGLRDKINHSLQESQEKLWGLPKGVPENKNEKIIYLIETISNLNNEIKDSLYKGKSQSNTDNLFYEWRVLFEKMRTAIDGMKDRAMKKRFTVACLKDEILKKRGNEISGFLNFELFESLVISHILQYKMEAESLLKEMRKSTDKILSETIHSNFDHLPTVESNLKQIAYREVELSNEKSLKRIDVIFEEERLVFTLDQAFEREMELLKQEEEEQKKKQSQTNSYNITIQQNIKKNALLRNTERMVKIIDCYLKIVHSRLSDVIPMAIRQSLHMDLYKTLKGKFIEYTTTAGIEAKVTENRKVNEERRKLRDKIERLQKAREELSRI